MYLKVNKSACVSWRKSQTFQCRFWIHFHLSPSRRLSSQPTPSSHSCAPLHFFHIPLSYLAQLETVFFFLVLSFLYFIFLRFPFYISVFVFLVGKDWWLSWHPHCRPQRYLMAAVKTCQARTNSNTLAYLFLALLFPMFMDSLLFNPAFFKETLSFHVVIIFPACSRKRAWFGRFWFLSSCWHHQVARIRMPLGQVYFNIRTYLTRYLFSWF